MKTKVFLLIGICLFLSSCASNRVQTEIKCEKELKLLFAGDIMAHTEITEGNYGSILDDLEPLIQNSDLAFANFESPINDGIPQSSYPTFNCHSTFADKIISYGFNVFSLANNHTNDYHLEGIESTKKYFDSRSKQGIYSAGLKKSENAPIEFITIEKNGIRILFASVTEVLNFKTYLGFFDFLEDTDKTRQAFLNQIRQEKKSSNCDLLILSFHTAEPEYIRSIAENSKNFYYLLIESGVDILWINHPHISKEWEIIHTKDNRQKLIFYSVGNTVSSQRRNPDFNRPGAASEFKGDSFLFSVKIKKTKDGIWVDTPAPTLITTYITEDNEFLVKELNDDLIKKLEEDGRKEWSSFLTRRKELMNKIKGKDTWQ